MHYIFESLIVGLYSLFIFLITTNTFIPKKNFMNAVAFFTGFLKHFLGWFLQVHFYYCNVKWKCKKQVVDLSVLFVECILEGCIFLVFYNIISRGLKNQMSDNQIFFTIGVVLHILSENLGIHKTFCKSRCKEK